AQHAHGVSVDFVDRDDGETRARVEADLLVACDGVHSAVRRALFPHEGPPQWNGVTMWRAVTERAPFLSGRTVAMIGGGDRRLAVYRISRWHEAAGNALINWVACFKTAPSHPMPAQDWQHTARLDDALEPFRSFVFEFLDVPYLIRGAYTIYRY